MRFWVLFWVGFGMLLILTTAFRVHSFSPQWWGFLIGSMALASGVALIVGEKKR